MARIYSWSGKKGTCWYLDYAVNGRRVRKRIGRSKRLAELALADITVKLERREIGFAESDKKLSELIAEYLRHSQAHATPQSHLLNETVLAKFRAFVQDDKLKNIKQENGLYEETIFAFVPDDRGAFWFSSGRGIFRLPPGRGALRNDVPRLFQIAFAENI